MSEAKTSGTVRIGDISGLREELRDDKLPRQRAALQKLLELDLHAAKDLPAGIFREVLMVRHQESVEIKKLMYCFFQLSVEQMQQSEAAKDVAYNVRRDLAHNNPVIRSMAAKFLGYVTNQSHATELLPVLKGAMSDGDPFVRKTAVMAVGRLYRMLPSLGETMGLLPGLEAKLQDESAMVAINALAVLRDLQATIGTELHLTSASVRALLVAMSEGSEWNQISVLEAVSQFSPADDDEASVICERVLPSLNHANSGVVLTAARVLLHQMEARGGLGWCPHAQDWAAKMIKALERCTAGAEPSVQWVVMKCLAAILERWHELRPQLDVRNFFIKYDDPAYIKQQKLDMATLLMAESNVERVLLELREYAGDADPSVARRAVDCMGFAALHIKSCADKVVAALMELMTGAAAGGAGKAAAGRAGGGGVGGGGGQQALGGSQAQGGSHTAMVQSIMPTMTKIFRVYPAQYESVIGVMCDNLDAVGDADSKAALLWVIGEYADFVVEPAEKLKPFCESLETESAQLQLAAVTAVTKVYLKVPTEHGGQLALSVLERATKLDNPDVRHRAFFYWHLLSNDPSVAKEVVLAERPPLDLGQGEGVSALARALVVDVPNLAVVYGVDPNALGFCSSSSSGGPPGANGTSVAEPSSSADLDKTPSLDVASLEKRDESGLLEPLSAVTLEDSAPGTVEVVPRSQNDSLIDLLDDDLAPSTSTPAAPQPAAAAAAVDANDPFALLMGAPAPVAPAPAYPPPAPPQAFPPAAPQPGMMQVTQVTGGAMQQPPQQQQQQQHQWGQPPAAVPQPPQQQQPPQQWGQPPAAAPQQQPQQQQPAQASTSGGWVDFQPGAAPPAATLTPEGPALSTANRAPPVPPLAPTHPPTLAQLDTSMPPTPGNPFASSSPTIPPSPSVPPSQVPGLAANGHASLPPISPAASSLTSSMASSFNPLTMSQVNPYASVASAASSDGMGYHAQFTGGYPTPAPTPTGNGPQSDFRASNGSWPYSPQTTGGLPPAGYGGYVPQMTGGFSQFATANFSGAMPGYGQPPIMQGGYQLQLTGGSMYGPGPGGFGAPTPMGSLLLRRDMGQGLEVYGQFVGSRSSGSTYFQLHLSNHSPTELSGFKIQFNKNQLGLAPARVNLDIAALPPGTARSVDVPVLLNQTYVNQQAPQELQIALQTQPLGTLFFKDHLPMHLMQ